MPDLMHRIAVAALVACGLLIAGSQMGLADGPQPLLQYRQFMVGLLGAGLVLAAFLPALRPGAIAAAALSEMSFVAIDWAQSGAQVLAVHWSRGLGVALLLLAGAVFLREARQQARWDGVLPLRTER